METFLNLIKFIINLSTENNTRNYKYHIRNVINVHHTPVYMIKIWTSVSVSDSHVATMLSKISTVNPTKNVDFFTNKERKTNFLFIYILTVYTNNKKQYFYF